MKHLFKPAAILLTLTIPLTGCVVIATDDNEHKGWYGSQSEWKELQRENKKKIAELVVGDKFEQIRSDMGTPDFNEAFESEGKQVQVLFYRTRHKHSDGTTSKDECTPLIFIDGTLRSWGHKAYEKL